VTDVAIIGGGISGLTTAYYLSRAGIHSTLIERQPRLGGVIQTETTEGCVLEAGPDSFISAKPWALELIHDLGLAGELIGSNDHLRVTYVKKGGSLIPLPDGLMMMVPTRFFPLLATRLLSWGTKARMAMECFRFRWGDSPQDDRSVAEFIRDHYGGEAVDYLAEPLLSGVYGGDPERLSVASVLPGFFDLEQRHGSLTRGALIVRRIANNRSTRPLFQTLRGGLGKLVEALIRAAYPYMEVFQATAETLERRPGKILIQTTCGLVSASHVVLACQANEAAQLVRNVDEPLARLLASIPYNSSVTVTLGYSKSTFNVPLNGFGFLVPKRERRRVIACTWVGTKFPFRVPEDKVVLRCFLGGGDEAILGESDKDLVAMVQEELREIMQLSVEPIFTRIARWPKSMAQYTVGHRKRLDAITARLEGMPEILVAGNGYSGIGIPDCIRTGKHAALRIAASV